MDLRKIIDIVGELFQRENLSEMANLRERNTGVPGMIYISTRQGSHSARIKYFPAGIKGGPNMSITVGPNPRVKVSSGLSYKDVMNLSKPVIEWITINYASLLKFWEEGTNWSVDEIAEFFGELKKV